MSERPKLIIMLIKKDCDKMFVLLNFLFFLIFLVQKRQDIARSFIVPFLCTLYLCTLYLQGLNPGMVN